MWEHHQFEHFQLFLLLEITLKIQKRNLGDTLRKNIFGKLNTPVFLWELGHMENELDLVHDAEELLLSHNDTVELDLADFYFVPWPTELQLTEAKAAQDRDNETNCGPSVRNYSWYFSTFLLFSL